MSVARALVAGLSGGGGKTVVTTGLAAAWRKKGLRTAPFKKGPDYIDAAWLSEAAGRPCRNLDPFLMRPETMLRSVVAGTEGADIALIEGNRGLFDGMDAEGTYSTAELAKLLRTPVLLAVDCTKSTRTVAAAVLGCQKMDPEVPLKGVILNRVSGDRHESVIREAVTKACGLPVLGTLRRLPENPFPERHLGLVPPPEHREVSDSIAAAAALAEKSLDLEAILRLAREAPPLEIDAPPRRDLAPEKARIGVFRDAAFQFYYPENLEALEREGGRVVEISPLRDAELPDVDALYLGGGFPETLAQQLSANDRFRASVRRKIEEGLPVYAECGGAVYLGRRLILEGNAYPMAGVLPADFGFNPRPQGHGYARLEAAKENPFFPVGTELRGHEFHYSYMKTVEGDDPTFAFRVLRGHGFDGQRDGLCHRNVLACYTHVHALGAETWAPAVVREAVRFRNR